MKRQIELIQKDGINIIVLGNGEEEIINIYSYLFETITNNKDSKHIIICDENLDYKINGCLQCESGSLICRKLKEKIMEKNYITFIRSANDSLRECNIYLERADALLPKAMLTTYELKQKIIKVWLEYFGYVKSSTIDYNLEGDMQEIIEIFLEDIDDFVAVEPSGYDWASFWSELHKLKGTLNILQELRNNTDIIALIESMRENNFDSDFKNLWLGLCEDLLKLKFEMITILNELISKNK